MSGCIFTQGVNEMNSTTQRFKRLSSYEPATWGDAIYGPYASVSLWRECLRIIIRAIQRRVR